MQTLLDMAIAVIRKITVPRFILQKIMHTAQILFGCASVTVLITDQNVLSSQESPLNVKIEFTRAFRLTSMDRSSSDSAPRYIAISCEKCVSVIMS